MSNKAIELLDKWDEMTEPYLQCSESIALEHADLMAQELRALHAEVEGMRKDAARYRWLRSQHEDGESCFGVSEFSYGWDFVGELDATIDKAMLSAT